MRYEVIIDHFHTDRFFMEKWCLLSFSWVFCTRLQMYRLLMENRRCFLALTTWNALEQSQSSEDHLQD